MWSTALSSRADRRSIFAALKNVARASGSELTLGLDRIALEKPVSDIGSIFPTESSCGRDYRAVSETQQRCIKV
jgi:hypothetical protein